MRRLSAIDIGTVTCRLLIADVSESSVSTVLRRVRITQLGEGLTETGVLSSAAIDRVCQACSSYLDDVREQGAAAPVAVATSAARDATNSADLVERLATIGVNVLVIPGTQEARLTFLGNASSFPGNDLLVADIGGGSTELVFGTATAEERLVDGAHSFNIGCRRMTDAFLRTDPPTSTELDALRTAVTCEMRPFFEGLSRSPRRLIACAGTATSVVSVNQAMKVYDADKVHGTRVTMATLADVTDRLAAMTCEQRRHCVGLEPGRAPIIVAGTIILECVMGLAGVGEYTVSETDILQGILMDATVI